MTVHNGKKIHRMITNLNSGYSARISKPKARPGRRTKETVDELLNYLKEEIHIPNVWDEKFLYIDALHLQLAQAAERYYLNNDKMPPPNLKDLLLWYLSKRTSHTCARAREAVEFYKAKRLCA
jgi:hypothetical protein